MNKMYREELSIVLSDSKARDIFVFISNNNIVTINEINNNFSYDNITEILNKLKEVYVIREEFIKTESGIEKAYMKDVILPGYEDILNTYI